MPLLRSRTRELVERRHSLARLLITLFFARIATTIVEVADSHVTWFSAVITLAIALEAWRAWMIVRAARRDPDAATAPIADSPWDRLLTPVERRGPAVLIALTSLYVIGVLVLVATGTSRETLLDVAVVGREATTLFFLFIVVAGYASIRRSAPAVPDGA